MHRLVSRCYASHSDLGRDPDDRKELRPKRRNVTVLSDDGRVQWSDLNVKEKLSRTTQQTFNFALVVMGVLLTVRKLPVSLSLWIFFLF